MLNRPVCDGICTCQCTFVPHKTLHTFTFIQVQVLVGRSGADRQLYVLSYTKKLLRNDYLLNIYSRPSIPTTTINTLSVEKVTEQQKKQLAEQQRLPSIPISLAAAFFSMIRTPGL